jgi:hypothetical protein
VRAHPFPLVSDALKRAAKSCLQPVRTEQRPLVL